MLQQLEKLNPQHQKTVEVLVIEDYKLTRMGLRAALKADPAIKVVGEAEDAETGLQLACRLKPDVVLMDLGLPGMNGVEATRRLKAEYPECKVIIYTSHDDEAEVLAALGAGANAYCLKDQPVNAMQNTIHAVAEGVAWLDPAIAKVAWKLFQNPPSPPADTAQDKGQQSCPLTEREMDVLRLLVEGKSNTEIAASLFISTHTAKVHVCNILQKLSVHDRVQAAVKAIKEGMV